MTNTPFPNKLILPFKSLNRHKIYYKVNDGLFSTNHRQMQQFNPIMGIYYIDNQQQFAYILIQIQPINPLMTTRHIQFVLVLHWLCNILTRAESLFYYADYMQLDGHVDAIVWSDNRYIQFHDHNNNYAYVYDFVRQYDRFRNYIHPSQTNMSMQGYFRARGTTYPRTVAPNCQYINTDTSYKLTNSFITDKQHAYFIAQASGNKLGIAKLSKQCEIKIWELSQLESSQYKQIINLNESTMVIKTDIALYLINKLGLTVTEAIELGECSLISGYLDYRIVYNGFDNKSVDWIILSSDAGLCIYEADYKQAKINIEKGMYRFIKQIRLDLPQYPGILMVNENIGLILTKNCSLVSLNFTDITPNVSDTLADYEDVQIILSYPEQLCSTAKFTPILQLSPQHQVILIAATPSTPSDEISLIFSRLQLQQSTNTYKSISSRSSKIKLKYNSTTSFQIKNYAYNRQANLLFFALGAENAQRVWLAGVGLDYIVEVREYAIWDWLYIFDNKDIAQNYAIDQNNIIIYGKDEHIWIFNSSGARSKTGDLGLPYLISKRNNIGVFISEDKRETIIADIVTGQTYWKINQTNIIGISPNGKYLLGKHDDGSAYIYKQSQRLGLVNLSTPLVKANRIWFINESTILQQDQYNESAVSSVQNYNLYVYRISQIPFGYSVVGFRTNISSTQPNFKIDHNAHHIAFAQRQYIRILDTKLKPSQNLSIKSISQSDAEPMDYEVLDISISDDKKSASLYLSTRLTNNTQYLHIWKCGECPQSMYNVDGICRQKQNQWIITIILVVIAVAIFIMIVIACVYTIRKQPIQKKISTLLESRDTFNDIKTEKFSSSIASFNSNRSVG